MASPIDNEITHQFRLFRVHKDGHVVLFKPPVEKIPPSESDPITGVRSKDIAVSSNPTVSARVFLPKSAEPDRKLPLLLYIHGGGFCMQSPFSPQYHNFVSTVVAAADVVAVSVDYGLFPDRPIPACYDDSWAALQWVSAHKDGDGPEAWLNDYADLSRVFVGGDSAGGNITHTLLSRVGSSGLPGIKVKGAILVHPYFAGTEDDHMWMYMCPDNKGLDDPRMRPAAEDLARLGCDKVVVFVAEKDQLKESGKRYVEELRESGWSGNVEMVESVGESHCFHLFNNPKNDKAVDLVNEFVSFIKQDQI
ncbi:Alpha/beta hydrolase fold [Trema orientale]|uniref:Alpha/beta hydrolase fold n=1 Tax=Trema orientale TaxID=63057 RepID=A0A2P5AFS7_TREOI|nr:Alpha/beta hydrolase fold [Trema orientale]